MAFIRLPMETRFMRFHQHYSRPSLSTFSWYQHHDRNTATHPARSAVSAIHLDSLAIALVGADSDYVEDSVVRVLGNEFSSSAEVVHMVVTIFMVVVRSLVAVVGAGSGVGVSVDIV